MINQLFANKNKLNMFIQQLKQNVDAHKAFEIAFTFSQVHDPKDNEDLPF